MISHSVSSKLELVRFQRRKVLRAFGYCPTVELPGIHLQLIFFFPWSPREVTAKHFSLTVPAGDLLCSSFARILFRTELKSFKALQSFGSNVPEGNRKKELWTPAHLAGNTKHKALLFQKSCSSQWRGSESYFLAKKDGTAVFLLPSAQAWPFLKLYLPVMPTKCRALRRGYLGGGEKGVRDEDAK